MVDIQLHTKPACRQRGARGFFNSLKVSGLRGSRSAAIQPEPRPSNRNHGHPAEPWPSHRNRDIPAEPSRPLRPHLRLELVPRVAGDADLAADLRHGHPGSEHRLYAVRIVTDHLHLHVAARPPSQPHSLGPLQCQRLLRAHRNQITFDLSHETECET